MDVVFSVCLYCDAWNCKCSCMEGMSVSSCRCSTLVSCVHPVLCPQCCILHDLQFVNSGRGCKRRPCGRGIFRVSKRHNLHEVGMLQTSVQIVSTQPCPQRWGPDSIYGQPGRRSLHGWLFSSQKRGTSSQILARRHIQINTLQSYGFVTSVTNK